MDDTFVAIPIYPKEHNPLFPRLLFEFKYRNFHKCTSLLNPLFDAKIREHCNVEFTAAVCKKCPSSYGVLQ